ncbi:ATP-binding protein, partial [Streptomyces oceani]
MPEEPGPEPVSAVELAEARIPLRYRDALADQPAVTDWVAAVAL